MHIVHYIDRDLLYVRLIQVQPLPGFRTKEDPHKPPKREWHSPILHSMDSHNRGQYVDSITLNEMTLKHLDELIEGLQAARETLQNHLDK